MERDAFGVQLGSSFLAHAALFAALVCGVHWRSMAPLFDSPVMYVEMNTVSEAPVMAKTPTAPFHKPQSAHRSGPAKDSTETAALPTSIAATSPAASNSKPGAEGQSYAASLRAAIDARKEYPAVSRARHEVGRVKVAFTVRKDGTITNIRVNEPSSFTHLNEAALSSVRSLGKFRPVPDSISAGSWDAIVPLDYVLE